MNNTTVGPANRPGTSVPGFPFVVRPDQTQRVAVTHDSRSDQ